MKQIITNKMPLDGCETKCPVRRNPGQIVFQFHIKKYYPILVGKKSKTSANSKIYHSTQKGHFFRFKHLQMITSMKCN